MHLSDELEYSAARSVQVFPMIEIGDIVWILCYGETCQWALSDCEFDPKQPVWFEITLQVPLRLTSAYLPTYCCLCTGHSFQPSACAQRPRNIPSFV